MADAKTETLVKSVEDLLAEKQAVASKERELIGGLNAVLAQMGYQVVPSTVVRRRPGRPPGSGNGRRRRGRKRRTAPTESGSGRRRRRGRRPGRPMMAKGASKRRGRPRKDEQTA